MVEEVMRYAAICRVSKIIRPYHEELDFIMADGIRNIAVSVHRQLLDKHWGSEQRNIYPTMLDGCFHQLTADPFINDDYRSANINIFKL